jgi:hypothetical protein
MSEKPNETIANSLKLGGAITLPHDTTRNLENIYYTVAIPEGSPTGVDRAFYSQISTTGGNSSGPGAHIIGAGSFAYHNGSGTLDMAIGYEAEVGCHATSGTLIVARGVLAKFSANRGTVKNTYMFDIMHSGTSGALTTYVGYHFPSDYPASSVAHLYAFWNENRDAVIKTEGRIYTSVGEIVSKAPGGGAAYQQYNLCGVRPAQTSGTISLDPGKIYWIPFFLKSNQLISSFRINVARGAAAASVALSITGMSSGKPTDQNFFGPERIAADQPGEQQLPVHRTFQGGWYFLGLQASAAGIVVAQSTDTGAFEIFGYAALSGAANAALASDGTLGITSAGDRRMTYITNAGIPAVAWTFGEPPLAGPVEFEDEEASGKSSVEWLLTSQMPANRLMPAEIAAVRNFFAQRRMPAWVWSLVSSVLTAAATIGGLLGLNMIKP